MDDCKVHYVPKGLEGQHFKENTPKRISLPVVYIKRAAARTLLCCIKLGLSVIVAYIVSLWALPAAFAYRGYYAVGGILAVFGLAYWVLTKTR